MAPQDGGTDGSPSSDKPTTPFLRPVLPPGLDDLVILARDDRANRKDRDEDGVFYWLKKDAYQNDAHLIDPSMVAPARELVEQGVVLAGIPVVSASNDVVSCYLVNLRGIRRPVRPLAPGPSQPQGKTTFNPPPPGDSCLLRTVPAMDDLVIVDRDGTRFYWVKKCEYQRSALELRLVEPILEEQVRLLTNQGVVLADIPGGPIPGVNDMGCLVNLKSVQRSEARTTPTPASGVRHPLNE